MQMSASGTTINLRAEPSDLSEVTPNILQALQKVGPQNISEMKFTIGKSSQGVYLRFDFLPHQIEEPSAESGAVDVAVSLRQQSFIVDSMSETEMDKVSNILPTSKSGQGDKTFV
ncbi:hypothetical protein Q1695_002433 [Nippostrongylus brasiliensis]|nr:hypothetical protein Q1695_002433 [Nippostrongylus brasiliensis]